MVISVPSVTRTAPFTAIAVRSTTIPTSPRWTSVAAVRPAMRPPALARGSLGMVVILVVCLIFVVSIGFGFVTIVVSSARVVVPAHLAVPTSETGSTA